MLRSFASSGPFPANTIRAFLSLITMPVSTRSCEYVATTGSETQVILNDVVKRVESLEKRVSELEKLYTIANMLSIGLNSRFYFEKYQCVYMDSQGFCKAFYWTAPLKGYKMREVFEEGEKRYYINVREHKWICALCPKYTPKHFAKTLDNLRAKVEALELELKSLKTQVV
jgi:hypothetical protein